MCCGMAGVSGMAYPSAARRRQSTVIVLAVLAVAACGCAASSGSLLGGAGAEPGLATGSIATPAMARPLKTVTVRPGDTLASLAHAHATTPAELATMNSLRPHGPLEPGQTLMLPD